ESKSSNAGSFRPPFAVRQRRRLTCGSNTAFVMLAGGGSMGGSSISRFLHDGPEDAIFTLLLAHGAGAPMDSAAMTAAAKALANEGIRVVRFEFSYMSARRSGTRKPPPKTELVMPEFVAA